VKRKIAAILAADIVGYSRLVGEDEEETLRRLESYRAVFGDFIARFGGRIFNTAGDAILAEFASAVDAVRCAIDTQESLRTRNLAYPVSRQMHFRIGITIGDVVQREGDLLGEGVNIAARLEGIAPAGGICVSRSVHEAVANKISLKFADVGEQQLKNLPDRIHAYTVTLEPTAERRTWLQRAHGTALPYSIALGVALAGVLVAGAYTIGTMRNDARPASEAPSVAANAPVPPVPDLPAPTVQAAVAPVVEAPAPPQAAPQKTTEKAPDPPAPAEEPEEEISPATDSAKCAEVEKEVRAIAACTRLLQGKGLTRSERATYRSNRGAAHLNRGDYDLALEDLNESLLLDPDDALANYNRGTTYYYKNDYEHALTDLKRSAKLDPDHTKTLYYLGRTLHDLGRNDEAVTQLSRAIAQKADDSDYYRFRADSYLDKGDYKHAISDYDEAIRLSPKYGEAYRGRGITWLNDDKNDKALDDLSEAISLDPADWFARSARGSAYVVAERYDDAIADQTAALKLEPNNAEVLNRRADALLRAGKPDEALSDAERAVAANPEFAIALTTRAQIFEALGRKDEAIADFKKALALNADIEDASAGLKRLDPAGLAGLPPPSEERTARSGNCARFLPLIGKTISAPCD
jgi:class 3 adenylate cyclase/tetratricopeptide (TPR) repeat protein